MNQWAKSGQLTVSFPGCGVTSYGRNVRKGGPVVDDLSVSHKQGLTHTHTHTYTHTSAFTHTDMHTKPTDTHMHSHITHS